MHLMRSLQASVIAVVGGLGGCIPEASGPEAAGEVAQKAGEVAQKAGEGPEAAGEVAQKADAVDLAGAQAEARAAVLGVLEAHRVSRLQFGHYAVQGDGDLPLISWRAGAELGAVMQDLAARVPLSAAQGEREGGPLVALVRDAQGRALLVLRAMPQGPLLTVVLLGVTQVDGRLGQLLQAYEALTVALEPSAPQVQAHHEALLRMNAWSQAALPAQGGVLFDGAPDVAWSVAEEAARGVRDRGLLLCALHQGRLSEAAARLGTRQVTVTERAEASDLEARLKAVEAALVLNGEAVLAMPSDERSLEMLEMWLQKMTARGVRLVTVSERAL